MSSKDPRDAAVVRPSAVLSKRWSCSTAARLRGEASGRRLDGVRGEKQSKDAGARRSAPCFSTTIFSSRARSPPIVLRWFVDGGVARARSASLSKELLEKKQLTQSNFDFILTEQNIKDFIFSPDSDLNKPNIFRKIPYKSTKHNKVQVSSR